MAHVPFGTAEQEVLLKFTSARWSDGTWTLRGGIALYESRAWTDVICQRLVRHGYLDEIIENGAVLYTINQVGKEKAWEIRSFA